LISPTTNINGRRRKRTKKRNKKKSKKTSWGQKGRKREIRGDNKKKSNRGGVVYHPLSNYPLTHLPFCPSPCTHTNFIRYPYGGKEKKRENKETMKCKGMGGGVVYYPLSKYPLYTFTILPLRSFCFFFFSFLFSLFTHNTQQIIYNNYQFIKFSFYP